jgi:hypothetical protein
MESAYVKADKRTRAAVAKITLDWQPEHERAFAAVKKVIKNQLRLDQPRPNCAPCLFTDA